MSAPGGPRGAEDMRYWPVTTNAGELFGRRDGIGHVAGYIQPVVNIGATPAAQAPKIQHQYFYGAVDMGARTNRFDGVMLEADGGGSSFFRDAFSMIANVLLEQTNLTPLIGPFTGSQATSDVSTVVEAVTIRERGGGSGKVYIFVDPIKRLNLDQDNIVSRELKSGQTPRGNLIAGAAVEPGGIPNIGLPLAGPLVGFQHGAIVHRHPQPFNMGAPFFPASLAPGEVFHVVSAGGLTCSITWSEYSS